MATNCGTIGAPAQLKEPNEVFWGLDQCEGKGVELAEEKQERLVNYLMNFQPIKCINCEE